MIKRLMKKKRGAAMELAIMTLLEIFALCLILLTIAELSAHMNKRISATLDEKTKISQIADSFVESCAKGERTYESFLENQGDYTAVKQKIFDETGSFYHLDLRSNGKTVLYVICDDSGKILRWTSHEPDTEESTPAVPEETGA